MIFSIGKHIVRHGDLMDGYFELQHGRVDYLYSDPPWGESNLKYWQTINRKMTGAKAKPVKFGAFLFKFFEVIKSSCKPEAVVFVEYGMRWQQVVVAHAENIGLKILSVAYPKYGNTANPLALFTMAWRDYPVPAGYADKLTAMKGGFPVLEVATAPFAMAAGKSILDPCCGMGYTARLAVKHGMTFYGNEINGKRLEKTRSILEADQNK